jgi:hypothetical protein
MTALARHFLRENVPKPVLHALGLKQAHVKECWRLNLIGATTIATDRLRCGVNRSVPARL